MPALFALHGHGGRLGRLILAEAGDRALPLARGAALPAEAEVVVDVTSPQGLSELLPRLAARPLPLVVGTTGELPWAALEDYAAAGQVPVAVVPNFSVGVPLLIELLRQAVGALPPGWDIEIVETHHNQKVDAPSGTAKRLARAVAERRADGTEPPTHSLRVGDTFGQHTVWLAGPGERIELTHVATRREVFAIGALRWVEQIRALPPGLHRP